MLPPTKNGTMSDGQTRETPDGLAGRGRGGATTIGATGDGGSTRSAKPQYSQRRCLASAATGGRKALQLGQRSATTGARSWAISAQYTAPDRRSTRLHCG